jgi:hypothetical protein
VFTVEGRSAGATGNGGTPPASDQKPQGDARTVGSAGAGSDGGDKTMNVKFLPVEMGIRDGENVEIVSGLRDGVRVITTGAGALKDGDRVVASDIESGRRGSVSEASNTPPQKAVDR